MIECLRDTDLDQKAPDEPTDLGALNGQSLHPLGKRLSPLALAAAIPALVFLGAVPPLAFARRQAL
jgi:hypothetical protein